jgi:hypothetical protein
MPILVAENNLMSDIIEFDYFFERHLLDTVIHSILKFRLVLTYCILCIEFYGADRTGGCR